MTDAEVEAVLVKALEEKPKGRTHWSTRSMAGQVGLSHATIGRIWRTFGLKPHIARSFKISDDPQFIDKVRDVVGLYLNPPDHAVVLSFDEKSQIQALELVTPRVGAATMTFARRLWRSVLQDLQAHGDVAKPFLSSQLVSRYINACLGDWRGWFAKCTFARYPAGGKHENCRDARGSSDGCASFVVGYCPKHKRGDAHQVGDRHDGNDYRQRADERSKRKAHRHP